MFACVCVYVCVCVYKRESVSVRECDCVCVYACVGGGEGVGARDLPSGWRRGLRIAGLCAQWPDVGHVSSDDEINGDDRGSGDGDEAAAAEVTSPTPADGAMQFGFEEE